MHCASGLALFGPRLVRSSPGSHFRSACGAHSQVLASVTLLTAQTDTLTSKYRHVRKQAQARLRAFHRCRK